MKKLYCVICGKNGKFQQSKISYFSEKTVAVSAIMKMKKYLKKRNQLKH